MTSVLSAQVADDDVLNVCVCVFADSPNPLRNLANAARFLFGTTVQNFEK